MSPLVRRAAVVFAAGAALLSGFAVHGGAQAQERAADASASVAAEAATLREAAAAHGKFVGTAVADGRLGNSTYTGIAGSQFSSVTAENVMKWESIEPSRGSFSFAAGDRLVDFAQSHDQQVWGHTLVWHSQLPDWVRNGGFSPAVLTQVMNNHITTVMDHYEGDVAYWDVVNEAFNEDGSLRSSVFSDTLGQGFIAEAFRTARAADPNAKLCINDYNTEGLGAKSNGLYNLVSSLLSQGVPIDCVGFQSHFILDSIPSSLQANMQRFADLGLELVITELDIRITLPADSSELQRQGQQFASVTNTCLALDACKGVTVWGFGDADSWVPGVFDGQGAACLYDNNYQAKPAFDAMLTALGGTPGGGDPDPDPGDPPGDCRATYTVTNRWNAGSVVQVSIVTDSALSGWSVTFSLPSGRITSGWNAAYAQSGTSVTATNVSYNGSVGAGGTLSFGFQTDSGAQYATPTVSLNGEACSA
ncbi:endo-1,4-beta-xylanase [Streptomyces sp. RFCAC02]|uniref:endo-1,4-beta-xylanase n=1 Tax=Streptomyces sp. RFCAC02 TaxID=2499143 RepID=UPI00101E98DF|nr:endo-1,4-beta-xylanase [Streptomyces sp. RFCAC02]